MELRNHVHQDTLEYVGVYQTLTLGSPLGPRSPSPTTYLQGQSSTTFQSQSTHLH